MKILKYIRDIVSLQETVNILNQKKEFSFDTEFDRFQFGYGFSLSLLQIFDGEICYIIDPKALTDLSPLWSVFENPDIVKIVYSCSEDVQILKVNGCVPRNIYDLQIVAKLCDHSSNSFSELLYEELKIEIDKSSQRSDWRKRPLSPQQIEYACNDVTPLLDLKKILHERAVQKEVTSFITEDNLACEQIEVSIFKVKLSAAQKQKYTKPQLNKFFALLELRNAIAKKYDLPPFKVFADSVLEKFLDNPGKLFTTDTKGLQRALQSDKQALLAFNQLLETDENKFPRPPFIPSEKKFLRVAQGEINPVINEEEYEKIKTNIIKQYGTISGEYLIRGFKKSLGSNIGFDHLKNYQKKVITEAAKQSGLAFTFPRENIVIIE